MTKWHAPEEAPYDREGYAINRYYIVAVRRQQSGKVWTFPATYLHNYPLEYRDGCICKEEHDDLGCPTTGWFTCSSDGEFDENYTALLSRDGTGKQDELVAWCEIEKHPLDWHLQPTEVET